MTNQRHYWMESLFSLSLSTHSLQNSFSSSTLMIYPAKNYVVEDWGHVSTAPLQCKSKFDKKSFDTVFNYLMLLESR